MRTFVAVSASAIAAFSFSPPIQHHGQMKSYVTSTLSFSIEHLQGICSVSVRLGLHRHIEWQREATIFCVRGNVMDKFTALSMFVEVAETGGFSSAARRLNIATSSVTRAVEALEESLG